MVRRLPSKSHLVPICDYAIHLIVLAAALPGGASCQQAFVNYENKRFLAHFNGPLPEPALTVQGRSS